MRKPRVARIVALVVVLACVEAAQARWESERDNKSDAELTQLDERKLFEEAFDVCVRRAALAKDPHGGATEDTLAAAEDYLLRIEAVVRQKTGTVPAWLRDLSFARSTNECQRVFRAFVSGETAPETKPALPAPSGPHATPTGTLRATRRPTPRTPREPVMKKRPNGAPSLPTAPTPTRVIRVPAFPLLWDTPTPLRAAPLPSLTSPKHAVTPERPHTPLAPGSNAPRRAAPMKPPRPSPPASEDVTDELPPWFR